MWRRSASIQNDSYTSASSTNSDALKFEAKVNVIIYGFCWTRDYDGKDFELKFQFRVGSGEPSEWYDISFSKDDIKYNEDNWKLHFIDF